MLMQEKTIVKEMLENIGISPDHGAVKTMEIMVRHDRHDSKMLRGLWLIYKARMWSNNQFRETPVVDSKEELEQIKKAGCEIIGMIDKDIKKVQKDGVRGTDGLFYGVYKLDRLKKNILIMCATIIQTAKEEEEKGEVVFPFDLEEKPKFKYLETKEEVAERYAI